MAVGTAEQCSAEHAIPTMSATSSKHTNISPSKRSFELDSLDHYSTHYAIVSASNSLCLHSHLPSKRRSSSSFLRCVTNIMLAERNSLVMSDSFPSFMSVYGSEESEVYRPELLQDPKSGNQDAFMLMTAQVTTSQSPQHPKPFQHSHRGSINSLLSDSTESSPTTTNSTFDSPLVSDHSPSASPESASSLISGILLLPAPPPTTTTEEPLQMSYMERTPASASMACPQTAPSEPVKLPQKLTVDTILPSMHRQRPATSLGLTINTSHPLSAPTSPLKEPMKSARKKPNGLTIMTPAYNQVTFPRSSSLVPATPSNRPALYHNQSSPALTLLTSPTGGPAGGMFLPLPSLSSLPANPADSRNSFMATSMPDLREESEPAVIRSNEAPERGYTDGPICIYDCGVYLYLEPTADEARTFDTIINVAKEVRNPIQDETTGEGTVMSVWRAETKPADRRSVIMEPQTAVSEQSFRSAWEWPQPERIVTPTAITPTQSTFQPKTKDPEYVHVGWDHNSEILDDLYPLCKLIDDRVNAGKRVLVHCQLGVSRSASLIIAYGLYKDYQGSFHAMYGAVKERSRWVGPNMSLIYQLMDFKNKLNRGDYFQGGKALRSEWFVQSPDGSATPIVADPTPSKSTVDDGLSANETIRHEKPASPLRLNKALPPVPATLLTTNTPNPVQNEDEMRVEMPPPPPPQNIGSTVKRAASRPLPFRVRQMEMNIPAHRPRALSGVDSAQPSAVMDLAVKDVPSAPSLFSPRATQFMATPFGIRGAGDLETPSNRLSKDIPTGLNWLPLRKEGHIRTPSKDPRSPHQQSEAKEILRSIDDYL